MKFTITMTEGNSTLPFTITLVSTGERFLMDHPSMVDTLGQWISKGYVYVQ